MATNRIQHFSVSSDFTSQSGAIAANDNANVALQKLQGSKIDLVTSPVANDILFTDVNGQAIDSGISAQTSGTLVNSATSIPTGNVIKAAIDAASQGLAIKNPSQVGTVTALPACTIDGTFQILTADANGALPSIDGYSSLAVGNQITVKEESGANAVNNGIYIITQLGDATTPFILTRSIQANTWDELVGAYTFILNGATLQGDGWVCNIASGGTLGTTDITFVQFNEGTAYTAGAGINIASNVISVANGGVVNSMMASDSVDTANIVANAVTTAKILDGNVTADKLASNSVITSKILDSNVTTAKIADANVTADKLSVDSVSTVKIIDANVTTDKIADLNVIESKLYNLYNGSGGNAFDATANFASYTGNFSIDVTTMVLFREYSMYASGADVTVSYTNGTLQGFDAQGTSTTQLISNGSAMSFVKITSSLVRLK